MKKSRPIICMNCQHFKLSRNVRLGSCCYDMPFPVYYNGECILGLTESVEQPKVEEKDVE
jgi:hypothetical protein